MPRHAAAGLSVVETWDGDAYLGRIERTGRTLTIRSGFRGHPVVLDAQDVMDISPAEEHPHVEVVPTTAEQWLQALAVDVIEHEACWGCRHNAAQALDETGKLHLLAERGLADPREQPRPPRGDASGTYRSSLTIGRDKDR